MKKFSIFILLGALVLSIDYFLGNFERPYFTAIAPVVGAALALGGASFLGNLVGGLFGSSSQSEANELNYEMFNDQLSFNDYWNQKQLDTSIDLFNKSNFWNLAEANRARQHDIDMFNLSKVWNSYSNQRKEMEKAGLNPAMMFAGGNLLNNVTAPSSGATAHSTPTSFSPLGAPSAPEMKPVSSAAAEMVKATSSAVASIAGALKDSADAKAVTEKLQPEIDSIKAGIENVQADTLLKSQQTSYAEVQTEIERIKEKWTNMQEGAKYTDMLEDIAVKSAQIPLLVSQQKFTEAQTLYEQAKAALTSTQDKQLQKQLPYLLAKLDAEKKYYIDAGKAAIMGAQAQQSQAYSARIVALATDAEKRALVGKIGEEAAYFKNLTQGQILSNTFDAVTFYKRSQQLGQSLLNAKIINKQEFERLMLLGKQKNWYDLQNTLNIFTGGMIGAGAAAGGASSVLNTIGKGSGAAVIKGFVP